MLVHSVYFWLKPTCTPDQVEAFRTGLESLRNIPSVEAVHVGTPAKTHRPVIDRTYTFGLTVLLAGMAEHDAYQTDPLHQAFLGQFSEYWDKVVIYDAD